LNRQNATVAARLRQKERKKQKQYAHNVRTYLLAARAACLAYFNAVQKTFFLLKYRRSGLS
jgi:hypothetical protein